MGREGPREGESGNSDRVSSPFIRGATVIDAGGEGWSLPDDTDVSFTATSVTMDAAEIHDFATALDQFVTVRIAYLPAPGATALLGFGGLAAARRRR